MVSCPDKDTPDPGVLAPGAQQGRPGQDPGSELK